MEANYPKKEPKKSYIRYLWWATLISFIFAITVQFFIHDYTYWLLPVGFFIITIATKFGTKETDHWK